MTFPPKAPDLRSGATTTTDNVVELRPFQVQNPVAPARWDPQSAKLSFRYEIRDPNRRIRSGRILYEFLQDGLAWVIIHSQ
jgi:hypothetical protein